ncbi:hypothetical protein [Streptomyces sp. CA-132043]|uniref:hypothetical protein n=1 Tax=Streptomyces sp. CA-132043 TaxID=3240048 RepID=UPI003D92BB69
MPDDDPLSVPTTGILTIEAWMRPDDLTPPNVESSGYVHWLGKITYGGGNNVEWAARMYSLDNTEDRANRISGYAFNREGGEGVGSYFQDPVQVGEWIHYVLVINTVVRDAPYPMGYTKIYKNGDQRDQDSLAKLKIEPANTTSPCASPPRVSAPSAPVASARWRSTRTNSRATASLRTTTR